MFRDVSPRALNDSLDHAYAEIESKQNEINKLEQKLKDIDNVIRGHYFEDGCKHEHRDKCLSFIANKIIEVTGYEPRSTNKIVSESSEKKN